MQPSGWWKTAERLLPLICFLLALGVIFDSETGLVCHPNWCLSRIITIPSCSLDDFPNDALQVLPFKGLSLSAFRGRLRLPQDFVPSLEFLHMYVRCLSERSSETSSPTSRVDFNIDDKSLDHDLNLLSVFLFYLLLILFPQSPHISYLKSLNSVDSVTAPENMGLGLCKRTLESQFAAPLNCLLVSCLFFYSDKYGMQPEP